MINAEKYKDELKSLNDADKLWCSAFDKRNMTFDSCLNVKCENCSFNGGKDCNNGRYNWLLSEYVEPILLTELEYNIIKFIKDNTKISYIARDKDGTLFLYDSEPHKSKANDWWLGKGSTPFTPFNKMLSFIKWEDEEPYSINDVLKNCMVISDNIVIHKIVDE